MEVCTTSLASPSDSPLIHSKPEDGGSMDGFGQSLTQLFPVMCYSKAPSTTDFSRLEALGLACANFHNYFQFNRDWNFSQLDDELHSLFPHLFEYLNDQPRVCCNPSHDILA